MNSQQLLTLDFFLLTESQKTILTHSIICLMDRLSILSIREFLRSPSSFHVNDGTFSRKPATLLKVISLTSSALSENPISVATRTPFLPKKAEATSKNSLSKSISGSSSCITDER